MATQKVTIKEYSNNDITVVWKPEMCTHSTKCWKGLIQVFNPKNRPWINMDGATTERIKAQVNACPSKALSLKLDSKIETNSAETINAQCVENGPLMIKGNIEIIHSNGTKEKREKVTAFCRCGASENKPFCDGMHRKVDFKA